MVKDRRLRRHRSLRHRISGTADRPRLCVRRSNVHIYAMLIDDERERVLTGVGSNAGELRGKKVKRVDASKEVGKLIASKARELGISKVVFDRAGYRFHGRIKAVAEGAREGGLQF